MNHGQMELICETCSARFQRDDHLRRHRLSHAEPRFKCADPQCGMRFHRRDAARRHEKSHQQTAAPKRRRPRRGILPCPRIATKPIHPVGPSSCDHDNHALSAPDNAAGGPLHESPNLISSSDTDQKSAMLMDCSQCAATNMLCDECISGLLPATGLGEQDWNAFRFCMQHFVRIHAQGFPFLHSSSWRMDWEQSGKLLAMAAVGGREIAPYAEISKVYFEMAVNRLEYFMVSMGDTSCITERDDSFHRRLLVCFETCILLIEYSVWSRHRELRQRGLKEFTHQAIVAVPVLADVMNSMPKHTRWPLWILLEESKRALWCFYCLGVKSGHFLNHPLSTPEIVKNMHLPCPDAVFEAPNSPAWRERNDSNNHQSGGPVLFREALYQLMSADRMRQLIVDETAKYSSHILICGVLDNYQTSITIPCNFATLDAYMELDMSRFRLRDDLMRALRYWKALFWHDPHELWHSKHPDHKLNDIMLWMYIEVQAWRCPESHPLSPLHRRVAAELALDIFSSISLTGFLEVGAKSPLYVERAVYFSSRCLASAMLTWLDGLKPPGNTGRTMPREDGALYEKLLDCLQGIPEVSSLCQVDGTSLPSNRLREATVRVWAIVTSDARWMDGGGEH
ncbi:uncharacterized protein APUU_21954S [Aspergillus puulaauensis]|uniref:C2H2-type domain-containing protein n=1 Tax=Aspergillus puulaauensis TaxID=1220207 RepID=A0A7R8AKE6_9EURO|nr:uncharacterized protein APUU_21954S [Aspergillus puulaauensis]BCS21522.1 hypothetical protein APUU_21954S [Aspergillus puulaauensis]